MFQTRSPRGAALKCLAAALILSLAAGCSTVVAWRDGSRFGFGGDPSVSLARAERMIDALDKDMTAAGTIGVKSPDVWGRDRLAKFRSEYEIQMSQWAKSDFKGVVNASISRTEAAARGVSIAAGLADPEATIAVTNKDSMSLLSNFGGAGGAAAPAKAVPEPAPAPLADPAAASGLLEPTIVLDEHSQYLNHLNQLRRINSGDDLSNRPGYALYLVRIPVTLSPGPKSRRGHGAIITVSAKSLMTKDTMRYALRNAVVNETVESLSLSLANEASRSGEPGTGPSMGSPYLVTLADSEILRGPENIKFLNTEAKRHLSRELGDEPHHRSAKITEWLRGEIESAYPLFERSAAPALSNADDGPVDPLEVLGDLLERRDFDTLAQIRDREHDPGVLLASTSSGSPLDDDLIANRRQTLKILDFSLRVQAAALNEKLKQDIIDQLPELSREQLRQVNFFHPDTSDEAFEVFEKYVAAKWPLRVYAIEPVIAQQNIADSVGRRSVSALNLMAGGPIGPLLGAGNLSMDRRSSDDEAAIRLNPTMVGFGAGENTFGWVFYPRLQTSREPSRNLFSAAYELLCGRIPGGKDQSIEPGQRECTALIVMPNFVPRMEFVTVANWFRTVDAKQARGSNIAMASDFAGHLIRAEEAVNRVRSIDRYRTEELQIAIERLNQLKSLMPTQRMIVRVPFASNRNDSRIFSRGDHLRPSLVAWHGKPPEPGVESTIFVEGNNFSVHDTHIIAGGRPAEATLISRSLMQVTIDKDAQPTPNAEGVPLLDISLATPNGPSNHLLIRMEAPRAENQKNDKTPPPLPQPVAAVGPPKPEKPKAPTDSNIVRAAADEPAPAQAKAEAGAPAAQ